MADIVDPDTRSRMMAAIRGKDTRPELQIRSALHRAGFRFRLHDRRLPGVPDIILPKFRCVIFVHGCFWHRHEGCRFATCPRSRREFWEAKFAANVERDIRNREALMELGWRVIVVWECSLKYDQEDTVGQLFELICSDFKGARELPPQPGVRKGSRPCKRG